MATITHQTSRHGYRITVHAPVGFGDNRDYRQHLAERELADAARAFPHGSDTIWCTKRAARLAASAVETQIEHGDLYVTAVK